MERRKNAHRKRRNVSKTVPKQGPKNVKRLIKIPIGRKDVSNAEEIVPLN